MLTEIYSDSVEERGDLTSSGVRVLSMNYVWINRRPFDADLDGAGKLCGVPLENLDLAVQNANRYPQAAFAVWVDMKLVDLSTRFWLDSFVYAMSAHGNLKIRNLRDIPAYAGERAFDLTGPEDGMFRTGLGGVYVRADLARVLVLDHVMREDTTARFVFYSDMDCQDVRLDWAVGAAEKHGCARHYFGGDVSHGYIGLDTTHPQIKKYFPQFVWHACRLARGGCLGVNAFSSFLLHVFDGLMPSYDESGQMELLPPLGKKIEKSDWIRDLGIS